MPENYGEIARGESVFEEEVCRQPEERDDWHARWLTMQAAYAEYRRSSAALECTRQTSDDSLAADQLRLIMLEGQQRLAFERYIDARIAFLESCFDDINRSDGLGQPGAVARDSFIEGDSRFKTWLSIAGGRPALQTLAVVLLCTIAFSVTWEQKRIRSLEAGQDQLRVALVRSGNEVRQLREKLDHAGPSAPSPAQRTQRIPPATVPLRPFVVARPAGKNPAIQRSATTRQQRPRHQADGSAGTRTSATTAIRPAGQATWAFSLSPSHDFKRVGPLRVLVKSVDARKGTASVSIETETIELDVQHLTLNQPVWLRIPRYDHPLVLVAERIMGTRIDGHLWEDQSGKRDLRASGSKPPKVNNTP